MLTHTHKQFEMQAQLAAVQKALQEQQYMLAQQAVDAQRQQQQSFQLAAQAQQLAALQQVRTLALSHAR